MLRGVLRNLQCRCYIAVSPQAFYLRRYSLTSKQEYGRQFEEAVVRSLKRFSFDVAVCGGPKDRGVDFRGVWLLRSSPVRVIGQCRRYKKRLGPRHVRELVGTLTHEPKGTVGFLVTENGYTKDAYEVFVGSTQPVVLTAVKGFSDQLLNWYCQQKEAHLRFVQDNTGFSPAYDVRHTTGNVASSQRLSAVENNNVADTNSERNIQDQIFPCRVKHGFSVHNGNSSVWGGDHKIIANSGTTDDPFGDSMILKDSNVVIEPKSVVYSRSSVTDHSFGNNALEPCKVKRTVDNLMCEAEMGVFTLFELNPAARKLLPHLVVGIKYKRWNSRLPDLCINEDNSFLTLAH